jgi:hypothetical protein
MLCAFALSAERWREGDAPESEATMSRKLHADSCDTLAPKSPPKANFG